jgi:hypothetical protein
MAYARRRSHRNVPVLLWRSDHEAFRTKAGIERAVIEVLRRFGLLPPEPKRPPPLRLVKKPINGAA